MNDDKRRKPFFGAKGPLPGGAGRYSLSSRPPKPAEVDESENPPIAIPGPSRVPPEAVVEVAPALPPLEPVRPASINPLPLDASRPKVNPNDAWKGSTVGGIGVPPQKVTSPKINEFKTTLALGSAPLRDFIEAKDDFAPGTIRGTPPPARPETSTYPPPADTGAGAQRSSARPKPFSSFPPETPKTERATVPPHQARRGAAGSNRVFDVESARPGQAVSTALHPDLLSICDDIGQRTATDSEVALLAAPRDSRDNLYVSAVAIARRLSQALPGEVVLVETDFESPGLAQTLGVSLPQGRGFSEQLHARAWSASASNLILTNPGLGFDALFEGRLRTPGLLWSDQFASVISTLRGNYSVVLLIAPNRLTAVDHRALSDVTDSVFVIHGADDPGAQTYLKIGPLSHKVGRTVPLDGVRVPKKRRALFA